MKKRLAAVLLASLLAACPAAVQAGDSETSEMIWAAESFAEDVLASDGETMDSLIEKVLPEGMSKEQAVEYLRLTAEVVTSEEFQALLAHVEVQELLKEVIKRGVVFVEEEPELVKEILRTLGIKEGVIDILALGIDNMDVLIYMAGKYLESEEGKQLIDVLSELKDNVDYQELVQGLVELVDTESSALPESTAESPGGEAQAAVQE